MRRVAYVLSPFLLVFCFLLLLDWRYPFNLPHKHSGFAQLVVDKDGQPLRAFADEQGIWRHQVSLEEVSPLYIQALLGYEDRWFYHHFGVNPFALMRAFWQNWRCDCVISGGSTLSMQVARRFHPHPKSITGKLQQMLRAIQLEWHLSKEEILTLYLNYAPFGGTIEGVQAASFAYLGKSAEDLTHAEAALLAVLPQAPSRMRPDKHPARAQAARDKVLNRLAKQQDWSAQSIRLAKQEIVAALTPKRPQWAPLLARRLTQQYPKKALIKTTLDIAIQSQLQENLNQWIQGQPKHGSAAILVLDNKTRSVLAYVGSADFHSRTRFGHVDMIQAIRSPGSALKPFVYAMAIEEGLIHSHSLLTDAPINYANYRPENFNRGFMGPVSAYYALQQSLNVPAVQVLSHLGAKRFYNRMHNAGINFNLPKQAQPNVSIALGGVGINLWDLVTAYSAFAQDGQIYKPRLLADDSIKNQPSRYLMHQDAAWIVYKILAENPAPNRTYSRNLKQANNYLAWKTGTSYGYRDAWAVGVSANYSIGVWLGRPDGTAQPGHFGALNAAPMLFQISSMLHRLKKQPILKPKSVTQEGICWPLGLKKSLTTEAFCHKEYQAWLFKGQSPATWYESKQAQWQQNPMTLWLSTDRHQWVDKQCQGVAMYAKQIALWPNLLEPWLPKRHQRRAQIPQVDTRCKNQPIIGINDLTITGLEDGNEFKSTRKNQPLPNINLAASGGLGARDWFINGHYIGTSSEAGSLAYRFKSTGEKQIVVIDSAGAIDKMLVQVHQGQ